MPTGSEPVTKETRMCTATGERVVREFIEAFNRGDTGLASLFDNDFQFFAVTDNATGRTFAVHTKAGLGPYLAERHEHHEQLTVQALETRPGWGDTIGISFVLIRRADDLDPSTPLADGKAAVRCSTQKIVAWAMAWPKRG